MRNQMGLGPNWKVFAALLEDLVQKHGDLTTTGLSEFMSLDDLVLWFLDTLPRTPDGINSIITPKVRRQYHSPVYYQCLEVLRTSHGVFFSAAEIGRRIGLTKLDRHKLRNLRRILIAVCKENDGRIRKLDKTKVRFGFR